jgi:hypothetical protein
MLDADRSAISVFENSAGNNVYLNWVHDNTDNAASPGVRGIILDTIGSFGVNKVYWNKVCCSNGDGIDITNSVGQQVFENISYDNVGAGYSPSGLEIGIPNGTSTGNLIYNNTFWGNSLAGINDAQANGDTFENNIIVCSAGSYGIDTGSTISVTMDYNVVYGCTNLYFWQSSPYSTAAALYSASSQGQHDINLSPAFANASGGQFWLLSGSPGVAAGTNLGSPYNIGLMPGSTWPNSVTTGDQNAYGSGWEIGAFVYVPPLTPPPNLQVVKVN